MSRGDGHLTTMVAGFITTAAGLGLLEASSIESEAGGVRLWSHLFPWTSISAITTVGIHCTITNGIRDHITMAHLALHCLFSNPVHPPRLEDF